MDSALRVPCKRSHSATIFTRSLVYVQWTIKIEWCSSVVRWYFWTQLKLTRMILPPRRSFFFVFALLVGVEYSREVRIHRHSKNRPSKSRETWPDVRERGKSTWFCLLSLTEEIGGNIKRGTVKSNVTFALICPYYVYVPRLMFPSLSFVREKRQNQVFFPLSRTRNHL